MGISSNQARFLALTSRQVDLEHRIQQICQRRLRLSSELENTATSYNNKISNRQLYTMNTANSGIDKFELAKINALKDENGNRYDIVAQVKTAGANQGKWTGVGFVGGTGINIWGGGTASGGGTITLAELGLPSTASEEQTVDAALRAGLISIAKISDEYTQSSVVMYDQDSTTSKGDHELLDWRTIPAFADELYGGDDVDAENKYDKTIAEINAQDKKLQLEQTSIEVEYKAITSEKESVKKILDTNAQASFKYFS